MFQIMDIVDEQALYSYFVLVLGVLVLVIYFLTFTLILISLIGGQLYLHKKSDPTVLGDDVPGVSIVKPLMASTEILEDMVIKLQQPNVALVHQMPFFTQASGLGSVVEKIYFGCALARYYIAFNMLGLCCVTGMSYLFKKSLLDQLNGLGWFGKHYLAEDYFLTKAMHEK
nr:hypothetical protein BaRGS_008569 [Batillaria attramentaria]